MLALIIIVTQILSACLKLSMWALTIIATQIMSDCTKSRMLALTMIAGSTNIYPPLMNKTFDARLLSICI